MEWPMLVSHPYVQFWVVMFALIFLAWLWGDALTRHRREVTIVVIIVVLVIVAGAGVFRG